MCLTAHTHCASGSVGGARPCQGRGRGFESRLALIFLQKDRQNNLPVFFAYQTISLKLSGKQKTLREDRTAAE